MPNKYIKGYIYNGTMFVVEKEQIRNAKDDEFVGGAAFIPFMTGEWINPDGPDENGDIIETCSNCGHHDTHSPGIPIRYCWFCGAHMVLV